MSALSKVGMSVFYLLVVRFGGCGSDGCLRSPPAVLDMGKTRLKLLVASGFCRLRHRCLPLRVATQMRNSGDGNQNSTPDRQSEKLTEIEEVECRRDHLQDDQRQNEPAYFAKPAIGIDPAENRRENGDEQIALTICRVGRIEPCQHYH